MKVSCAATAVEEIEEVLDFLTDRSPKAASLLVQQLQDIERRLAAHPSLGRLVPTRDGAMRRLVLPPYLVFYRTIGNDVIVIGLRRAPSSMPRCPTRITAPLFPRGQSG